MNRYYIVLLILGITSLLASFLPILIKKFKFSFTIPLLIFGAFLYYINMPLPWPNPVWEIDLTLRFSELVVIISLMVAGLKIGLNYSWKEWQNPIRLLSITMPLFMGVVFLISHYLLNFNGPISLLLAAVLAPTDPALASEIQLNKKQSVESKNVGIQYNLTAEAGLNDGLAFPFVFLAILWSKQNALGVEEWKEWLSYYVLYKVAIGTLIGAVIGFCYSYFTKKLSNNYERKIHQAFVALSLTFISYGLAEMLNSYGFLSVFFTGLFANYHKHTKDIKTESDPNLDFITNTEKFLITFWMIFFGGSVMAGILNFITLPTFIFACFLVLIARPLLGYISLKRTGLDKGKRLAISFLGIRGIGSVFYLTYAIKHGQFNDLNHIFSIVALVILISILIHGFSAKRIMKTFEK
ncbi:cation:proton antiporter [Winogradskyella bathintestinalis]|uniref:Cation:proton antiporter n=1 Tax=Winogradskyella bathintestinalis TaxID=3035208 RepID=A0ABT7ZU90_9FLAO|nr:cation:proton antiporter [Winogradskyella bathintestinalis]MDN3492570.1 cation:proton antiporter [Winogradskyella bathintestinalis]